MSPKGKTYGSKIGRSKQSSSMSMKGKSMPMGMPYKVKKVMKRKMM